MEQMDLSCPHAVQSEILQKCRETIPQGRHFNFFLGAKIFFIFLNATGLLKNWEKQHFICSNLTLFIVPSFFLSFSSSFFSFFFLFRFFLSFFLFSFSLGEGRRLPPAPSNDAPAIPQVQVCFRFQLSLTVSKL